MKIVIVGSGGVGESTAAIAQRRDPKGRLFEKIVLADYDLAKAEAVSQRLGDAKRFPAEKANAANVAELVALVAKHDADVLCSFLPVQFNPATLQAALTAKVHHLDASTTLSTPHPTDPFNKPGKLLGEDEFALLVTTTSVRDSGLLAALLPVFQQQTGIRAQVIAVGSGAALRMGRDGNADVLLTHAPEGEEDLVASGAAIRRTPFMENYFVIAGPPEDPAGVRGATSPADAIRRIAAASARFVSRGDDSGTHRREVALFEEAGLDPDARWPGFMSSGAGMGETLQIAGEKRAYVLSDIGTFLAFQKRIELEAFSQPAPSLRNEYSVVRLDPDRLDPLRAEHAAQFEAFLLDPETQRMIADFGNERFGRPLFRPLHLEPRPEP